jgi:hypothetical protein
VQVLAGEVLGSHVSTHFEGLRSELVIAGDVLADRCVVEVALDSVCVIGW